MKHSPSSSFVCPLRHTPLKINARDKMGNVHAYANDEGTVFPVVGGIPDFTYPQTDDSPDAMNRKFYEGVADVYDKFAYLTFSTHNEKEREVRSEFIELLKLKKSSKVLETGCGTGRDSELIAAKLGKTGELALQDITPSMLTQCVKKLKRFSMKRSFNVSNAINLPYPDRYFDCVYSFGGLSVFSDIKRALGEMVRVCKVGGRIVAGDESIPPWLLDTEFAKILATTNPLFRAPVPLECMPVEARKPRLQWVIGGVYYLIDFEVGEGEPKGNFDVNVPSARGGTLRTRYEGQLEGVTPEAKKLAHEARKKLNLSMHDWLDQTVKNAAKKALKL
jgi:ubiquinone/menaquinone biosynthesis C-methylase UbiE